MASIRHSANRGCSGYPGYHFYRGRGAARWRHRTALFHNGSSGRSDRAVRSQSTERFTSRLSRKPSSARRDPVQEGHATFLRGIQYSEWPDLVQPLQSSQRIHALRLDQLSSRGRPSVGCGRHKDQLVAHSLAFLRKTVGPSRFDVTFRCVGLPASYIKSLRGTWIAQLCLVAFI